MYSPTTRAWMLCIYLLLAIPIVTYAQPVATPDSTVYKNKLTALPFISSSPETSLMFGVFGVQQFKTDKRDTALRSSSVMASVIYTLENQLSLEVYHTVFTPGEKWLLPGKYFFSSFSEKYWERGLTGPSSDELKAEYRFISGEAALLRRAGQRLYIGPQVRAIRLWDAALYDPEGNLLPDERNYYVRDYTAAGGGVQAVLDRRNSIFFPTRGLYAQLSAFAYPRFLSTTSFGSVLLDARTYRELGSDRSVLAGQANCRLSVHEPPFKELALVGGSNIMRGYYKGHYRDDNALQVQAEWRRHLSGRWGLSLFAAGADLWHGYPLSDQFIWAAGGGLRYNTNKRDKNNIRLDYGFGKGTSGIYLTIGEAF
jgi:hypothetical protein